jgi:hypothetical protein
MKPCHAINYFFLFLITGVLWHPKNTNLKVFYDLSPTRRLLSLSVFSDWCSRSVKVCSAVTLGHLSGIDGFLILQLIGTFLKEIFFKLTNQSRHFMNVQ